MRSNTARQELVLTLTFHHVGTPTRPLVPGEQAVSIETNAFTEILDAVANRPNVVLTFDDGNVSDVEIALPALVQRGLKASFFVCAGRLGTDGFLSAEDLRTLVDHDMSVGNHGMWHRAWRGLDASQLDEELVHARQTIEAAGATQVREASCPFGAYDAKVLATLRRCGYERAYTSDGGSGRRGEWLQPRYSVRRGDDAEHVHRLLERERSLSRYRSAARAAKRALKRWR